MVNEQKDNIKIDGYFGTWYVIDSKKRNGETLLLLEHEQCGDECFCLIVKQNGTVVLDNVWNGFEDLI
jgi:hypothetical protein